MADRRFPSLDEICRDLDRFVNAHGDIAQIESLGDSEEGRQVQAVHVTDPGIGGSDKQVAIVICGRHGNELGTRVVGAALLEWLASQEGAQTRRRQQVIVVPVANPDGCARNEFHAPPRHLSETEQRTIAALARRVRPDAIIDVHSFGPTDGDLQALVTGNNTSEGEDEFVYHAVAREMVHAAAAAGYPFVLHTEKRNEGYNNFIAGFCYDHFHTLAFGMEVNHHALRPPQAAESGVAVTSALLRAGNTRRPWQKWEGYPNSILKGDFFTSIRPVGPSAGQRRGSRSAIWADRKFFWIGPREAPDRQSVRVPFGYSGYRTVAASHAFTLCCRLRGFPDAVQAKVNGRPVEAATFKDDCSTYVSLELHPSQKTDYEAVFEF